MRIGGHATDLPAASEPHRPSRRQLRSISVVLLATLLMLMAIAPGADASTRVTLSVSGSGVPGTRLVVRGTGLPKHVVVGVRWDGSSTGMPVARTTYYGILATSLTVPARVNAGRHSLTVVRNGVVLARATVTVLAAAPARKPSPKPTPKPTPTPTTTPAPAPTATPTPSLAPTATPTPTTSPTPTPTPTATPTPTPAPSQPAKLLFGLGPELDGDLTAPITSAAPVHMFTSWFNGTGDLSWMTNWAKDIIPQAYAKGDALHLIVYASDSTITATQTKYGTAYGRAYPLTSQFLTDMTSLSKVWAGPASGPPLYVTLFTEFQTYAQTPVWDGNVAYWSALKDAYRSALAIFHANAPNAHVSLGWGGWEDRMSSPMFADFADVMSISDFQSFQAMQSDTNVSDIEGMTAALSSYGPVMCAHYKPDNGSQTVFDADTTALFTDAEVAKLTSGGLFAFSFMDDKNMDANATDYARITAAIQRYGQ